jgi:hypothetical protein
MSEGRQLKYFHYISNRANTLVSIIIKRLDLNLHLFWK